MSKITEDFMAMEAKLRNKKSRQMIRIPIFVGIISLLIEVTIFLFHGNIANIWPYFIQEFFNSLKQPSEVIEFIYWFRIPFDFIASIFLPMIIIQGIWSTRSKMKDEELRDNLVFTYMPGFLYFFFLLIFELGFRASMTPFVLLSIVILLISIIMCFAPTKGLLWTVILNHAILLAIGTIIAGFLPALCFVLPLMVIQHSARAIKYMPRLIKSIKLKKILPYLSGE